MTEIVAAFAATGKTYLGTRANVVDLDSRAYSWTDFDLGVRNPNFPTNYLSDVKSHLGKKAYILVSSNAIVREALVREGLPFTVVYPDRDLKDQYTQRLQARGSSDDFINNIVDNWDDLIGSIDDQEGCKKIVLQSGQYLSDVLQLVEQIDTE